MASSTNGSRLPTRGCYYLRLTDFPSYLAEYDLLCRTLKRAGLEWISLVFYATCQPQNTGERHRKFFSPRLLFAIINCVRGIRDKPSLPSNRRPRNSICNSSSGSCFFLLFSLLFLFILRFYWSKTTLNAEREKVRIKRINKINLLVNRVSLLLQITANKQFEHT